MFIAIGALGGGGALLVVLPAAGAAGAVRLKVGRPSSDAGGAPRPVEYGGGAAVLLDGAEAAAAGAGIGANVTPTTSETQYLWTLPSTRNWMEVWSPP